MKLTKFLLIMFAVTIITSSANIFAWSTFDVFKYINVDVPKLNGKKVFTHTVGSIGETGYDGQGVAYINIANNRELDARLRILNNSGGVELTGSWKVLRNGSAADWLGTAWGFQAGGEILELTIDSRLTYLNATHINARWGYVIV